MLNPKNNHRNNLHRLSWFNRTMRGMNWFCFRYWWFVLLLFFITLLLIWFFCGFCWNKNLNNNCEKSEEVENRILRINDLLNNCCDCNSNATLLPGTPNNEIPCNGGDIKSGGQGVTRNDHILGTTPGLVLIDYNMYNQKDQMDVYYDGSLVATTGGIVSFTGKLKWYYPAKNGSAEFCSVIISAPEQNTKWTYILGCPEQQ